MKKIIPFSLNPNDTFSPVVVNDDTVSIEWLVSLRDTANKAIASGKIKAFEAVAFESRHLLGLLPKPDSQLGFYHALAAEGNANRSMLVAVSLDSDGEEDQKPEHAYIGVPVPIDFNNAMIDFSKIKFISTVNTLKWQPGNFVSISLRDWLSGSRQQDSMQKAVDMITKVVFKGNELLPFLTAHKFVAFCLVIFKCIPDKPDFSDQCCNTYDRYSTLMTIGLNKPDDVPTFNYVADVTDFQVSSNAWRPNYPRTIGGNMLKRIFLYITQKILNILFALKKSLE